MRTFAYRIVAMLSPSILLAPAALAAEDEREIEEVIVAAHPLSGEGLAQPVEVLEGEALARELQGSIGATLANQPGIHQSSFGQAASRPVVHGLSGARVRIMEDRADTLDVSVTSPDHAVSIEPFIADRIEILKGPSTLLYGSGAIGGVVDVHTGRIPHGSSAEALSGRLEVRGADNGRARNAAFRLDGGGALSWHADGFLRDAEEYDIPGPAESARQRALESDEEHEDEANGRLPGSQLESAGGALGASYVGDRGFAGIAVSTLSSEYGLPGGHGHAGEEEEEGEAEEEGNPLLDMEQTRIDFEAALRDPLRGFSSLNLRLGVNDYEHREIEPSGETGTRFTNEAVDARVELSHDDVAGWRGALGLQFSERDFAALGEEAFTPPVDTRRFGLFWVGERPLGGVELETGLRVESVRYDPAGGAARDFSLFATSLGLVAPFANGWRLALSADLASRAPVAEELYSDGPHLATGSFELGDDTLEEERSFSLSATADYSDATLDISATLYAMRFSDFIYERATGEVEDGLPVFAYTQNDATFFGVDARAAATVARWPAGRARIHATFDTVAAELDKPGNDNLPRIPPTRYGLGLALEWGRFAAAIDYTLVEPVLGSDVAELELPTDGYNDLRAYLGARFSRGERQMELFVQGRNLTDDEQRNHSSFIKEFAPQPGRTVEAGIRLNF